ncbi:hypothetical protein [Nitrosomonas sp. Nm34]|uniref:hypothetical protein n=1 Tax=Nitrosomonas sp. Nm34 TaxID=1881055 RepID=UPI0008DF1B20|nr:hypothetical protein [Nitrosomonas sp. Nm34]SFI53679.1 hypothetical protein SAMN05428978_101557 [Nitrosomonas sp. Nm34]
MSLTSTSPINAATIPPAAKNIPPIGDPPLLPFLNQNWREGEPETASIIQQGEADKVSFNLEME